MLGFQNTKTFLLKDTLKIGQNNTVPWTYVMSDLNGREIAGSFCEEELQKTSSKKIQNRKST